MVKATTKKRPTQSNNRIGYEIPINMTCSDNKRDEHNPMLKVNVKTGVIVVDNRPEKYWTLKEGMK